MCWRSLRNSPPQNKKPFFHSRLLSAPRRSEMKQELTETSRQMPILRAQVNSGVDTHISTHSPMRPPSVGHLALSAAAMCHYKVCREPSRCSRSYLSRWAKLFGATTTWGFSPATVRSCKGYSAPLLLQRSRVCTVKRLYLSYLEKTQSKCSLAGSYNISKS